MNGHIEANLYTLLESALSNYYLSNGNTFVFEDDASLYV